MQLIWEGIRRAFELLASGNPEVYGVVTLTLAVSGLAILAALLMGIPTGTILALSRFPGRRFVVSLINTGMGLPPVVVGLIVVILLWRSGPLGFLNLLYTPAGMVLAQIIIAYPIVTGLSMAAIQHLDPKLKLQTMALGANKWQLFLTLIKEARLTLLAAVMAGFGSIISEVGAVMMVGGNIKGQTRVLTTATVMEARMGHFHIAIALGAILLALTFAANLFLTHLQQKPR